METHWVLPPTTSFNRLVVHKANSNWSFNYPTTHLLPTDVEEVSSAPLCTHAFKLSLPTFYFPWLSSHSNFKCIDTKHKRSCGMYWVLSDVKVCKLCLFSRKQQWHWILLHFYCHHCSSKLALSCFNGAFASKLQESDFNISKTKKAPSATYWIRVWSNGFMDHIHSQSQPHMKPN